MLAPIHKITVNVMITNVHRLAYSTGKPTTTNRTATGNRIFQNGELLVKFRTKLSTTFFNIYCGYIPRKIQCM